MKNTYEIEVEARCPRDPEQIDQYDFVVESEAMIEVEALLAFFEKQAPLYQERLTQACAEHFNATVTSVGEHSGVKVTSVAP